MKHRIPTRAMAAAAALLLLAGAAAAAPKGKRDKPAEPPKCLSMDLDLARVAEGFEARLMVQWNCPRSRLHADLAIDVNGRPIAEARIEGAANAAVAAPLDPAQFQGEIELCGRVDGEAVRGKKIQRVAAQECYTFEMPPYEPLQ